MVYTSKKLKKLHPSNAGCTRHGALLVMQFLAHSWCGKETMCRRRVKCTRGALGGMEYEGGGGHGGTGLGFVVG